MAKPSLSHILQAFGEDFTVEFVPSHDTVAQDQLFVQLDSDDQGRTYRLELVFLPDEDEFYNLQFFVLLPYEFYSAYAGDLARLLMHINARLPLIGFGMSEQEGWIFYRCVVPCPNQELDPDVMLRTAWLIAYIVDRFGWIIESMARGGIDYANATAQVDGTFNQPLPAAE